MYWFNAVLFRRSLSREVLDHCCGVRLSVGARCNGGCESAHKKALGLGEAKSKASQ